MSEEVVHPNSTAIIHPPPFAINGEDRSGVIIVVTTFCLVSIWVLFAIRTYIRLHVNKAWKLDDWCVLVATALSTARSGVVYLEVHRGYGKSIALLPAGSQESIGKAIFGDLSLFIFALFLSKCAVLLLCQRMTPKKEHYYAIVGVFALTVVWTLSSVLLVTVKCSPGESWEDVTSSCSNLSARWMAIGSTDIITELLIFSCLVYLVWGLHMPFKLKALVITAFGIRLPTVIFSGLHLRSILKEIAAPDPSLAGAVTLAWRQLELDFAITACTFSSLGAFFKPFDHAIGASRTNSHYMNSGRRFPKSSHISATRSRTDQDPMVSGTGGIPVLRPDRGETTAAIVSHSPQSDRQSLDSNDSKKGIIMKKQWVVEDDLQR